MDDTPNNSDSYRIPVEDSELKPAPDWATGAAKQEDRKWDDLYKTRVEIDKRWLVHYGRIVCLATYVIAGLFSTTLVIWVLHYILPIKYNWLCETQLSKIQSVMFSGSLGVVVAGILQKQLGKAG